MQKIGQYWVPEVDARPGYNLDRAKEAFEQGRGVHISHLERAIELMDCFDLAIDGGANIGSWTRLMAEHFDVVHAFEPQDEAFACLERNVQDWGVHENVILHHAALSDKEDKVRVGQLLRGHRTISSMIIGAGDTPAYTIDSLNLEACSLIKLDVEGYEARALAGAARTIEEHKPWIMTEIKRNPDNPESKITKVEIFLEERGYRLVERLGDKGIDWLFSAA